MQPGPGQAGYAFVADEVARGLSVFNLARALRRGFNADGVDVGIIPLGQEPVGVAVAPGGAVIYVTTLNTDRPGRLWVIDARRAEDGDGRAAVLAHVAAGCEPGVVRVGSEPAGLLLLDRGRVALVGDSNRYQATGGGSSPQISVVSTADALARRPAVTGSLPAGGLFPVT
jgi:DNA-binding beta-propeller fold protein YncE